MVLAGFDTEGSTLRALVKIDAGIRRHEGILLMTTTGAGDLYVEDNGPSLVNPVRVLAFAHAVRLDNRNTGTRLSQR